MKCISITTAIVVLLSTSACQSTLTQNSQPTNEVPSGVHKVVVEEVLQTSNYTYLRVKEGNNEQWLAASKLQASVGETYYYENGLSMTDFESKELNKTFKTILFLDNISSTPTIAKKEAPPTSPNDITSPQGSMPVSDPSTIPTTTSSSGTHKVLVKEVLQTSNYTYLRVTEDGDEQWLAVPKMQASVGETYYYENPLQMVDFSSTELKRTFKVIYFLNNVSATNVMAPSNASHPAPEPASKNANASNIKIESATGGITIGTLYKDRQSYSGKIVRIKGQVTKFISGVMNTNWIHIQDGTENLGKFDLTSTTNFEAKVGDIITLEGTITLNKDFGFGYSYEVIMENAKIIK